MNDELEDKLQEAYIDGYVAAEVNLEMWQNKLFLSLTHFTVALLFFILGLLYNS